MSNRRSIVDFPRNEAGLVDEFIGTAFDIVYAVYQNLDSILSVNEDVLEAINAAVEAAKSEVAAKQAAEDAITAANSIIGKVEQALEARDSALSSAVLTLSYLELVQAGVIEANAARVAIEDLANQVAEDAAMVGPIRDDLSNTDDLSLGTALIGTRLPSPSLLNLAIGRALTAKLYDTVSIMDFITPVDVVTEGDPAADWYPVFQRAFDWVRTVVAGRKRGTRLYCPAREYPMSQVATCNVAPTGTISGTGMVSLHLTGDGDTQTVFVAKPLNTTGCIRLTSDRNTECFRVDNMSFLSDLAEDAAANNGIALQVDSSLTKGMPGHGDHPRWSVQIENVFIGGYGATAGDLARRGNWKKGIYVANKWYPQFKNVRCLARYSGVLGARTACDYAIHLYNCYSPDFSDTYIHGNWDNGIYLGDILDAPGGGWEDFRFINTFCVGPNKGITIDHPYTDTEAVRLNEPGGCISVLHINCRQFGVTIKNHRQVMIDGVYGYTPNADRRQGELLPSVFLLDGASDIRIKAQILEPGFYNSNTDACVGVRIEGSSEAITLDLQLGAGGIGILNNSTAASKSIFADLKLKTSRRNAFWTAPLVPVVDNAGGVTYVSNDLGTTQDRVTIGNSKLSAATYPVAHRLHSNAPGQLIGGAFEISGLNSAGATINQFIMSSRFSNITPGAEASEVRMYVQGEGGTREALRLSPTLVDNETYANLLMRVSGALVFKRVTLGPADSAGSGFRTLRVSN